VQDEQGDRAVEVVLPDYVPDLSAGAARMLLRIVRDLVDADIHSQPEAPKAA
jgi:hypothetical protein